MSFDPHPYSEKSARAKLARARSRGETDLSMVCCQGQWYVGNFALCQRCDGWGREFSNGYNGTTRECPSCSGDGAIDREATS